MIKFWNFEKGLILAYEATTVSLLEMNHVNIVPIKKHNLRILVRETSFYI